MGGGEEKIQRGQLIRQSGLARPLSPLSLPLPVLVGAASRGDVACSGYESIINCDHGRDQEGSFSG
jgi:hypothetical protein